jgi:hypothetical protein
MTQVSEKTYQMLWDCKYCRQRKNLGLTHRHCPSCGAPQDTTSRYFPPDSEKVAVEDHPFVGADVLCPACGTASSRAAKCCGNCGGPLTGGASVGLVQVPVVVPAKKSSKLPLVLGIIAAALLVLGGTCAFLLRKRSGSFEVKSAHWQRTIAVERLDMKQDSAWCNEVPADGHILGRHDEQRTTKQVPDGQTCTTTKKDQGNGTYKEVEECKPKYKSEPVLDAKCNYEAPRWVVNRTEKSEGDTAPAWPAANLGRTGTTMGAEREGAKTETYTVTFVEPATGKTSSCDFPEPKWSSFKPGAKWDGKIGAVTGSIDCASLQAE